ncbi:hypothetical protein STEG23_017609, partial [Scotinomys teguina]
GPGADPCRGHREDLVQTRAEDTQRTWCRPVQRTHRGAGADPCRGHTEDLVQTRAEDTQRTWCRPVQRTRRGPGADPCRGHAEDLVQTRAEDTQRTWCRPVQALRLLLQSLHKKQSQHLHSTSLSPKASPEERATRTILLLMSFFVLMSILDSIISCSRTMFLNDPTSYYIQLFVVHIYATISFTVSTIDKAHEFLQGVL